MFSHTIHVLFAFFLFVSPGAAANETSLDSLTLSLRLRNGLSIKGIRTVAELRQFYASEGIVGIKRLPNFGPKAVAEIELALGIAAENPQVNNYTKNDSQALPDTLPLSSLDLTDRTKAIVKRGRIETVGDLRKLHKSLGLFGLLSRLPSLGIQARLQMSQILGVPSGRVSVEEAAHFDNDLLLIDVEFPRALLHAHLYRAGIKSLGDLRKWNAELGLDSLMSLEGLEKADLETLKALLNKECFQLLLPGIK